MTSVKVRVAIVALALTLVLCFASVFGFTNARYYNSDTVDANLELLVFDPDRTQVAKGSSVVIPLDTLYPGCNKDYTFTVKNKSDISGTNVPLIFNFNLVSYGNLPVVITVKKDNSTISALTHDHSSSLSRIQTFSVLSMGSSASSVTDTYTINISWNSSLNDAKYSTEVEYLAMFCTAYQK